MNVICATGYIVSDLELKSTPSGVSVCSFAIAVRRPHVKDQTDFVDCVAWREKAEFLCKYFSKGSRIEISGHLEVHFYENQQKQKRKDTIIYCDEIGFGDRKNLENAPETPSRSHESTDYSSTGYATELNLSRTSAGDVPKNDVRTVPQQYGGQQEEQFSPANNEELPF